MAKPGKAAPAEKPTPRTGTKQAKLIELLRLSERGLIRADLDYAIAELERSHGIAILTIVGVNDDDVFGSREKGCSAGRPRAAR